MRGLTDAGRRSAIGWSVQLRGSRSPGGGGSPAAAVRAIVDAALSALSGEFAALYSHLGRPSIPPEQPLRALLLQAFYSVRSERLLIEQLDFCSAGLWGSGSMIRSGTRPRSRLTATGCLEAWASMKSFRPRGDTNDPPGGRNGSRNFHGEQRRNDAEARLFRKGAGNEAKLCFMGHLLMENRSGLVVAAQLTQATGLAEREAAGRLIEDVPGRHRIMVGADRAYDTADFAAGLRALTATPHVAQNVSGRTSRIDRRTVRHPGYLASQRARKRIEEAFAWIKTIAGQAKTSFRGTARVGWAFTLAAAHNLIRLPKLLGALP